LREARRLSGTSGACSLGCEFSSSGSETLTPLDKPKETEEECLLLFPLDEPLLIDLSSDLL